MRYEPLGRSGLLVSPAALGTMNFGTDPQAPTPEPEARRIIGAFLDAGHTLIDTADIYRGGTSEEIVGRAISHRRADVILATKGGAPQGRLSRAHLTRALEESLRRLNTDYIDLYQCHVSDKITPPEETMATLDSFVRSGKVRYLGCSNFTAAEIAESQWSARLAAGTPLISLQANYSLIARTIETEIIPTCHRHGLGILAYSPLGSGLLAGRYPRAAEPPPGTRLAEIAAMPGPIARAYVTGLLTGHHFDIADETAAIAAGLGTTPAAVALAWLATRPAVTATILGPRTLADLQENLKAQTLELPPAAYVRLEAATTAIRRDREESPGNHQDPQK